MNKKQLFDWVLENRPEQFKRVRNVVPFSTMFVYEGKREKQLIITRPFNVYLVSGDINEVVKSEEAFRDNSLLVLQENRWLHEGVWNDYINEVFADFLDMHDNPKREEKQDKELDKELVDKFAEVFSIPKVDKKPEVDKSPEVDKVNRQKEVEVAKKESEKIDKMVKETKSKPKEETNSKKKFW